MEIPDLSDLTAFAAVAEARSFRRAAALRGVSASSLSEAVRRLEARLNLRLLNRTTRSVTPTEAGQRLLERLKPALSGISEAIEETINADGAMRGTIRLNVPTAVAELVLPDILAGFLCRFPGVSMEIVADNSFIDVLAAGFDAGIRYGERLERDMIAIPIGPRQQRFVTAATPSYLDRRGRPSHPNELMQHDLIRFRFASGIMPPWEFLKDGEALKISGRGPLVVNNIAPQIAAAEAGLGIMHAFEGFLNPSILAGRLEPVLDPWTEWFAGPFLYFANRRQMPQSLRAFIDHVRQLPEAM